MPGMLHQHTFHMLNIKIASKNSAYEKDLDLFVAWVTRPLTDGLFYF
jgi:hypothetical protein